jgi:hypothetical protein
VITLSCGPYETVYRLLRQRTPCLALTVRRTAPY